MWFLIAWRWLKKYWMWLLFPVGIFVFILGKLSVRKLPDVVAPELVVAEEERRRAREMADRKVELAEEERERRLAEVAERHSDLLKAATAEQACRVVELQNDPDALNDYLLDVGAKTRGQ